MYLIAKTSSIILIKPIDLKKPASGSELKIKLTIKENSLSDFENVIFIYPIILLISLIIFRCFFEFSLLG